MRTGVSTRALMLTLLMLLAAAFVFGLAAGSSIHGPVDSLRALFGDGPETLVTVVREVRLPRLIACIAVGAGLACAGVLLQGVTRNVLADPFLMGTSAGASVAVVAIRLTLPDSALAALLTPIAAFAGALAAVLIAIAVARLKGRMDVVSLLLAGMVVTALCSASISFMAYLLDPFRLRDTTMFLTGGMWISTWAETLIGLLIVCGGFAGALLLSRELNSLAAGVETARALGVSTGRLMSRAVLLAAMMSGAAVALGGLISFVGLLVPHTLRLAAGRHHGRLLPAAFLGGAAFLLFMDTLARILLAPMEIPVGVLTSLCGAPLFLFLLMRRDTLS
ncbi:MAG: Hemin transport system permease protein HmuU [Myxococcota bacterium]|nr:Hemin transport system permease protein HmuU [Myxococcota bacterium]